MSAALLLALAVLLSPVPARLRVRAWRMAPTREASSPFAAQHDPLAAATTFDTLSVCLAAGLTVSGAARAVAATAPGELAQVLHRAADLLAIGADAATAWTPPTDTALDEQSRALLRLARRSADSGTALADGLAQLAVQSRDQLSGRAEAAAGRAAVVIAGPLGLCFLPAFLCLGVIPVVAGLATKVLGTGLA